MEFKMKTMKYILLIICVNIATSVLAIDYKLYQTSSFKSTSSTKFYSGNVAEATIRSSAVANVPVAEFRSTSTMPSVGSTLSTASSVGVVIDEGGNTKMTSGPKRAPALPPDPFLDPIGDAILPLALLAAAYVLFLARKKHAAN
jgi:hypothetical protein